MNESLLSRRRLLISALATLALPAWAAPSRKAASTGSLGNQPDRIRTRRLPVRSAASCMARNIG